MRYLFIVLISLAMLSCNKEKGCTNVNACVQIATADVDDGSCYSPGDDCDDGNSDTESDVYDNNCNCSGVDMPDSDALTHQLVILILKRKYKLMAHVYMRVMIVMTTIHQQLMIYIMQIVYVRVKYHRKAVWIAMLVLITHLPQ